MNYPILITEVPHRGPRRTWLLRDDDHFYEVIEAAEGFEGEELEEYLDWLRSDLQQLIVTPADQLSLDDPTLDLLPDDQFIKLIDPRARSIERGHGAFDAEYTAQWRDADGKVWDFPCYIKQAGKRTLLWSYTDEAGLYDVTIDIPSDDLAEQVREFAEDIAYDLGELVEETEQ